MGRARNIPFLRGTNPKSTASIRPTCELQPRMRSPRKMIQHYYTDIRGRRMRFECNDAKVSVTYVPKGFCWGRSCRYSRRNFECLTAPRIADSDHHLQWRALSHGDLDTLAMASSCATAMTTTATSPEPCVPFC
jgi:hypothetical protein